MPDFVYVLNDDPQHFSIKYVDNGDPAKRADLESGWKHFNRTDPGTGQTYKIDVRPTNPIKEVIVDRFFPSGHPPGRYRLDVFVPGKHATSRKAIYSVLHSRPSEGGLMKVEESTKPGKAQAGSFGRTRDWPQTGTCWSSDAISRRGRSRACRIRLTS